MTDEELAQIQAWQSSDEGLADMSLHALQIACDDLWHASCSRDGFRLIRTERARLIEARAMIERLIAATSMFHTAAAE